MKICVVTPYDADNMGAMCQALSLKRYLEGMGHEVFHLRIHSDEEQNNVIHLFSPNIPLPSRKSYIRIILHPRSTFYNIIKSERIRKWRQKKETIMRSYLKNFQVVDEKFHPDLFIVGSDEVWNIHNPLFQKCQFWNKKNGPCFVYAASMSDSDRDTFLGMPHYIESFENYDVVSVRDQHTQNEFSYLTNREAKIVVDPTILNYDFRMYDNEKENIIVVYGYSWKWDIGIKEKIKKFARDNHLKIVSVGMYLDFADENILCNPDKFAKVIASAKYVITTTFHGTIFSILTKSQFVTYDPLTKASNLLISVGAEDQIVSKNSDYVSFLNILTQKINYEDVFCRLKEMRDESKTFINDCISDLMEK